MPKSPLLPDRSPAARGPGISLFSVLLATLVYIFAMQWVGFAVATLLFFLAFIVILGERRKWVLIFSPPLVTVFILVVFSKFIAIPFPKGIGVFAELSRFFF